MRAARKAAQRAKEGNQPGADPEVFIQMEKENYKSVQAYTAGQAGSKEHNVNNQIKAGQACRRTRSRTRGLQEQEIRNDRAKADAENELQIRKDEAKNKRIIAEAKAKASATLIAAEADSNAARLKAASNKELLSNAYIKLEEAKHLSFPTIVKKITNAFFEAWA